MMLLDVITCYALKYYLSHTIISGDVDMGITGEDVIAEAGVSLNVLLPLGFGKCKLCVLAPKGKYSSPSEIAGKRIVTSFPNLSKKYLAKLETDGKPTAIRYAIVCYGLAMYSQSYTFQTRYCLITFSTTVSGMCQARSKQHVLWD